jgi:bifunctional non-homologous end joining protein LigD
MFKRSVRPSGFVEPCIPTLATAPPTGIGWAHEIKHDGYRLLVRRDGISVRLFTRRGYDWTGRYPVIAEAAGRLRASTFTSDGEAVVCGPDGVAIFDALHTERRLHEAFLYAFDLIEVDGQDLRSLPYSERKLRAWHGCWRTSMAVSPSTSMSRRTVPRYLPLLAGWGWRALCRSVWMRPTGRVGRATGSRPRIPIAQR